MYNPYIQVMCTYLQRPFCMLEKYFLISFISLVFTGALLPVIYIRKQQYFVSIILLLFVFLYANWVIHVKEQFASARASLMPGFRKIHGAVAIISGIVFVILLPGATALLIGWQPIGLISVTTILFSIILWTILRMGSTFITLICAGWVFSLFEPIRNNIEKIVSGNWFVNASIIICIGAILSIAGIIRLFLLREGNPEYRLNFKASMDDFQGRRRRFINRTAVKMIYHARHASDSYRSRMLRWNLSNGPVWSALFYATCINLSLMLFYFLTDETFLPEIRILVATLMPVFLVIRQFNEKSSFMAQDIMMPVRRDAYLKQVVMYFAIRLFIQWGVFLTVTVLLMFTSVVKPTAEFFIVSISYSLMAQIGSFGLVIWISSFGSNVLNLFNFLIIIKVIFYVMIPFISALNTQALIPLWSPIVGVLFAGLGLELTGRGYRRWMAMDLD